MAATETSNKLDQHSIKELAEEEEEEEEKDEKSQERMELPFDGTAALEALIAHREQIER